MAVKRAITGWRSIAAVAAINVAILFCLLVLVELALGKWFGQQTYCLDTLLHHGYCPGIVNYNTLSDVDGGARVENVIDESRVRVPNREMRGGSTDISQYDVINIGDSFLEADEVPYEQTLTAVWSARSGRRMLQFGSSSWAPIIYYNWLARQRLKPGVTVNLFISLNDMTPAYATSNLNYHRQAMKSEDGIFLFPKSVESSSPLATFRRRSWFYNAVYARRGDLARSFREMLVSPSGKTDNLEWIDGDFSVVGTDCTRLDALREAFKKDKEFLTLDYLAFSFSSKCWSEEQKLDVDSAVDDINRIVDLVARIGGKVNVFMLPSGWAFPGENLPGKAHAFYRMKERTVITGEPLAEYVRAKVRAPVISLEPVIRELKRKHPGTWYFPLDGHWTPHAHHHLGQWFAATFH